MPSENESGYGPPGAPSSPFPKKRFGQHFLIDKNIVRRIISAARLCPSDRVLEIGPGTGALTEALLEAGASVTAIEVDKGLAALLAGRFSSSGRFEVITGDALKVSFVKIAEERGVRFKAISNLPYNISGPILAKFLEEREAFTDLMLMFQKEVARRISSGPGTKDYGILSVLSQAYADVRIEFDVPPACFSPRPKVDSSVVSFKILASPRVPIDDQDFFKRVVRAAFGQRRKTLLNSLKPLGIGKEALLRALDLSGIDPKRRGETLSLKEFGVLAGFLIRAREDNGKAG